MDTFGYQVGLLFIRDSFNFIGTFLIYNLEVEVKLGAASVRGLTALTLVAEPAGSCYHFGVSTQSWKRGEPFCLWKTCPKAHLGHQLEMKSLRAYGASCPPSTRAQTISESFSQKARFLHGVFPAKDKGNLAARLAVQCKGHCLESGADAGIPPN